MSRPPFLIADIGGTNARFALASPDYPYFESAQTFECIDYPSSLDAVDRYLQANEVNDIAGICFAVAGIVKNHTVNFINSDWVISAQELKERYSTHNVHLLNDFESIAYSLSQLDNDDILQVGNATNYLDISQDFNVAVIGPGTGLGVAGLIKRNDNIFPITTEGGHVGFAPDNALQQKILDFLHLKYPRVSNERLLSGQGLMNIHEALCSVRGEENPGLSPADIACSALDNSDTCCSETMKLFFEILGQVAGDIVLALGAYDGIFIGGGITQRYPNQLIQSNFRNSFENKGRYQAQLQSVPTWLITHKNAGLLGASYYARTYLND